MVGAAPFGALRRCNHPGQRKRARVTNHKQLVGDRFQF